MSNTDPIKNLECTQVFRMSKQYLPLARHPPCSQYSFQERVTLGRRYETLMVKEEIRFHLRNGYSITIDQFMVATKELLEG